MSERPQYPSYPGDEPASGYGQKPPPGSGETPPPGYGQQPPPAYGQQPPPGWGQPPPPGWGQSPQAGYGYGYTPPPTTNAKAVTGMILGIVSIVFCYLGVLIGPAAIIVSVLANKEINAQPPGAVPGKGMATAGLVTGIVGTVIWAVMIALTIVGMTVE